MKEYLLTSILILAVSSLFGQDKQGAERLVDEGIAYHDKGDFKGAITKYDKALEFDKDNLLALAEKSFSLFALNKYDDAIALCKKAIELHPGEDNLKTIYVTYGNALDALKKTGKSIEVYDEGIELFPEFYQLYFNKGISLSSVRKNEEALLCFQKSVIINPKHASSHNAIARILHIQEKNIPSLFAFCRFLILEPQSGRAKGNLELLQKILKGNVEQTEENNITISMNPNMLAEVASKDKAKENSFSPAELMLNMTSALDYDKKNAKKTDVEQFVRKFETVCAFIEETKSDNSGFYWEYYVPYFIELNNNKLIEPLAYIAFASSEEGNVTKWLKSHQSEINSFYEWDKSYSWDHK